MGLTTERGPAGGPVSRLGERLTGWLTRSAVRRPHVLVVTAPGCDATRLGLEGAAAGRGWVLAASPADADALVVCGRVTGELASAVEVTWQQLPGPRARQEVTTPLEVEQALDRVLVLLGDEDHQRRDAARRPLEQRPSPAGHGDTDSATDTDSDVDMEMSGPGGIPLASGGEDRDGLEMDVLHVQLGPVLGLWPTGLVVTVTLQGDVVVDAEAHRLPGVTVPEHVDARVAACERAARVLALAGSSYATEAVRLRDAMHRTTQPPPPGGGPAAATGASATADLATEVSHDLRDLLGRVQRSRALRWSLGGLGQVDAPSAAHAGLAHEQVGDVRDRLVASLRVAAAPVGAEPRGAGSRTVAHRSDVVAELPGLVRGWELAEVRLGVASLDLGPDEGPAARSGSGTGTDGGADARADLPSTGCRTRVVG